MNYRRAFVPNGYLHIIITSYDRKPIFIENIDILRTAFKNTKTIYEFEIIAICVLPNHIHLILHPNNIEQYPQIISSIKHYFSRNVGQVCPIDQPKLHKRTKMGNLKIVGWKMFYVGSFKIILRTFPPLNFWWE